MRSWNGWGSPARTIGTVTLGDRLGLLTTGLLWSWHCGHPAGERRYLIDLLETLPQAVLRVLLVCDAGYVGYDLFGLLL